MARSFDADAKTRELLEAEVKIGGELYHPARLTPDVRREQMRIATAGAKLAQDAGLSREPGPDGYTPKQLDKRADAVGEIDEGVTRQLCVLLRNESNEAPTPELLNENLDNRVANKLLGWLLEDQEGEAEKATTASASGS